MLPPERQAEIIVVTGLPRSGTSLAMQMLAAGGLPLLTDNVRPPDDDNPRGYCEYAPVLRTARDASWVSQAEGRAVKVVHALIAHLPAGHRYRVILMDRPLPQVLASQRKMLALLGRPGASLTEEQLAAVFARQLEEIVNWMEQSPEISWFRLRYPEVVADPAWAATALNRFLGGGLNEKAMASVVDPSLYRQKHP